MIVFSESNIFVEFPLWSGPTDCLRKSLFNKHLRFVFLVWRTVSFDVGRKNNSREAKK